MVSLSASRAIFFDQSLTAKGLLTGKSVVAIGLIFRLVFEIFRPITLASGEAPVQVGGTIVL